MACCLIKLRENFTFYILFLPQKFRAVNVEGFARLSTKSLGLLVEI
jgi:hypothetical protein